MNDSKESMRLSKYLSQKGVCSRREADALIERGLILVNGQKARLGQKVNQDDTVEVLKSATDKLDSLKTLILHKPVGFVSAQAEGQYKPAIRLIIKQNQDREDKQNFSKHLLEGLAPAGRLDIDSKGLLILTQDGVVARAIIGPESQMEKEYIVKVQGTVSSDTILKLTHGLELDGKALKRAKIKLLREGLLNITLREGKKRQIRRMCEAVNLKVLMLKRVRIGPIRIGELQEGSWRHLSAEEVQRLKRF